MQGVLIVRTAVFVLTFLALLVTVAVGFVSVVRRRERLTVENPNPGYRKPALHQEVRDVSAMRLLKEMPWQLGALYLVMALMSAGYVAMQADDFTGRVYRVLMPRYDEVPENHRGMVFDRFGGISDDDVRQPGSHFVWSGERLGLISCLPGQSRHYSATAVSSDGRRFEFSIRGSAVFRCDDASVHRIMERLRYGQTIDDADAWDYYVRSALHGALEDSISGHTARYVHDHEREITDGLLRLLRHGLADVEVGIDSYALDLWGEPLPDEAPRSLISSIVLPEYGGWSVSGLGDDTVRYSDRRTGASVFVQVLPSDGMSRERTIELMHSVFVRGDENGPPTNLTDDIRTSASGDPYFLRRSAVDGVNMFELFLLTSSAGPEPSQVLVTGVAEVAHVSEMLMAVTTIADGIGTGWVH